MKRKIMCILLAAAMLTGLLPVTALAVTDGGDFNTSIQWSYSDGTLSLTGSGHMLYSGTTPWDKYKPEIRRVEVGYGITTLYGGAFAGCTNLTDVDLPGSLQNIGDNAFADCTSLTSIDFPSSLELIGEDAFRSSGLKTLEIPGSVWSIYAGAFSDCDGLTEVVLPDTITSLGSRAFYDCDNLTTVDLPAMSVLGEYAFGECSKLKTVYWSKLIKAGYGYFYNCNPLTVYYEGSESNWSIIEEWRTATLVPVGSVIYYNSTGSTTVPDTETDTETKPVEKIPTPTLKSASYADGAVTVQWTLPQAGSGETFTVDGYEVLRKTESGSYQKIGSVGSKSTTSYRDTTVEAGKTYWYTVRAVYGSNSGSYNSTGLQVLCELAAATGHAVSDGNYTVAFRSSNQNRDLTHSFYYSEDFFTHPSTEYNHDLAKMTLGLVMAGFSSASSDYAYTTDGDVGREDNIRKAYETLGFDGAEFYYYNMSLDSTVDKVAFSFARKTITENGKTYTVIPVILRGGGYGAEWASNFYVNADTSAHTGFRKAEEKVYSALKTYLEALENDGTELGTIKLWIGGYSRAAAAANLLAAEICNGPLNIEPENVYAYTFATPNCVTGREIGGVSWQMDNNYTPGMLPRDEYVPSCIHNIIYSGDMIPRLPLNDWGYGRNGNDLFLPVSRISTDETGLYTTYRQITGETIEVKKLVGYKKILEIENALADACGSADYFEKHYQDAVMDIAQYLFMVRSRDDQSESYENLDEISRQIASLDNVSISAEQVAKKWGAAQTVADLLQEHLGVDVPVPLVMIGLIHNMGLDALGLFIQYKTGGFPDDLMSGNLNVVPLGHYPELYLAMLEYYDYQNENDYFMYPTTRTEISNWFDSLMPDVARGSYYNSAVTWAVSNGVANGTSATTFSPDSICTRAQVVTFLWRACGAPMPTETSNPFRDVSPDDYFYPAVLWAVQAGVTGGTSATTFSPNSPCTRAQVVTFLYRAQENPPKLSGSVYFHDVENSDYYWYPVKWAVSNNITDGTGNNMFSPDSPCTRAQAVTFLYRAR